MLILSLIILSSCKSIPETGKKWETEKEYFSYYSLNNLPGVKETGWIGLDNEKLWTWSVTPENYEETVVFLHGYLDHSALNSILFDFLISRNYRVYTFDLPGHGRSGGERGGLESFSQYTDSLDQVMGFWQLKYEETIFIGHSTGGAILLDRLISEVPMKAVILGAPLLQFRHFDSAAFILPLIAKIKESVGVMKKKSSSNEDFNNLKKNDPMRINRMPLNWPRAIIQWQNSLPEGKMNYKGPLLILQGEKDHVVYYERNLSRIESWFPQAQIHYYPDLMHQLLNEADREALYSDLADFLESVD